MAQAESQLTHAGIRKKPAAAAVEIKQDEDAASTQRLWTFVGIAAANAHTICLAVVVLVAACWMYINGNLTPARALAAMHLREVYLCFPMGFSRWIVPFSAAESKRSRFGRRSAPA